MATEPVIRFLGKIDQRTDGCWNWTAKKINTGYGRFVLPDKNVLAHRWSYEFFIGAIPKDWTIDHLCRNRTCVNPTHLEPVTRRTNILRGEGQSATNARKVSCVNGHAFKGDNVYVDPDGHRSCRVCRRNGSKARYRAEHPNMGVACKRGHVYTTETSFMSRPGVLACRTCQSETQTQNWARKKAA